MSIDIPERFADVSIERKGLNDVTEFNQIESREGLSFYLSISTEILTLNDNARMEKRGSEKSQAINSPFKSLATGRKLESRYKKTERVGQSFGNYSSVVLCLSGFQSTLIVSWLLSNKIFTSEILFSNIYKRGL